MCVIYVYFYYRLSKTGNVNNTIDSVISWLESYFASSLESIKEIPSICPSVFSQKGTFITKKQKKKTYGLLLNKKRPNTVLYKVNIKNKKFI